MPSHYFRHLSLFLSRIRPNAEIYLVNWRSQGAVRKIVPIVPNWIINAHTNTPRLAHTHSSGPPAAFLDWPTVEGLEAFAEKKVEYGEMMDGHVTDLQAVIREQRIIVDGLRKEAELAEEHRLQEFQRDLERMDPVEAEVAQRAERDRALLVQGEYEARLAELNAKCARERASVRAKSQYDG